MKNIIGSVIEPTAETINKLNHFAKRVPLCVRIVVKEVKKYYS